MRQWVGLLALLLVGCSSPGLEQRPGYVADGRHPAPGARPRIKAVVIHYTAEDYPTSLATLRGSEVSVHYLLPAHPAWRNPTIVQLVPEAQLAWHAGPSFWRGASRLNDTSIGIELVNPGYTRTLSGLRWAAFPPEQIAALQALLRDIVQRYGIPPENIVGHSDIAPQRKQDPGPRFPWVALARAGLGAWPDAGQVRARLGDRPARSPVQPAALLAVLARYGYEVPPDMTVEQQRRVIAAFQMHFRPADTRGLADAETLAIAEALVAQYGAAL
ncbi:N-acetylmuramoyl-L-alanine amidase [Pantoea sp. 1.19]|uniref:N-acetylmuramoyl-L-alanine amidase n=1 Tax=Pantoea sp. 1.19 TaxID=1925589 RepID=UPI000948C5EF|nr:N-acetylmuramoyl-L-alanine amidase [Pantoea sp. 1.19]